MSALKAALAAGAIGVLPVWAAAVYAWFGPTDRDISGPQAQGAAVLFFGSFPALVIVSATFGLVQYLKLGRTPSVLIPAALVSIAIGGAFGHVAWDSAPGWEIAIVAATGIAFLWLCVAGAAARFLTTRAG